MAYQVLNRTAVDEDALLDDQLDVIRFAAYIRSRWTIIALACSVAVAAATIGSLFLTKKYTATASLLIEPPAGNDPRGATAISPVYLESLKTYERLASSDTVFAQALHDLHLREESSGIPIESLKKQVLRVTKPRDMKILEIRATLPNPLNAQALARRMAEKTVELSGSLDQQSQRDLTEQVRQQLEVASARVAKAEKARDEFLASDPTEMLEAEIRNGTEQKLRLQTELIEARIDLVDYEARARSQSESSQDARDAANMREQLAASKARTARIEQADRELGELLAAKTSILEKRKHQRDVLDIERQSARAQYELASTRHNDTLASAAFRSERLQIVDPGTLPEQPSSPNIPLNAIVSFFAALLGSSVYLAIRFSYSRLQNLSRE